MRKTSDFFKVNMTEITDQLTFHLEEIGLLVDRYALWAGVAESRKQLQEWPNFEFIVIVNEALKLSSYWENLAKNNDRYPKSKTTRARHVKITLVMDSEIFTSDESYSLGHRSA